MPESIALFGPDPTGPEAALEVTKGSPMLSFLRQARGVVRQLRGKRTTVPDYYVTRYLRQDYGTALQLQEGLRDHR
ncbi:MAG: hypothetical protein ACREA0_03765, partial [bacterium]